MELIADPGPARIHAAMEAAGPSQWEILPGQNGAQLGVTRGVILTLLKDGVTRLFKRRGVRGVGTPTAEAVDWLVAELDGIRVYVQPAGGGRELQIVVTKTDLWP